MGRCLLFRGDPVSSWDYYREMNRVDSSSKVEFKIQLGLFCESKRILFGCCCTVGNIVASCVGLATCWWLRLPRV